MTGWRCSASKAQAACEHLEWSLSRKLTPSVSKPHSLAHVEHENIAGTEHLQQGIFVELCLSGWICLGFPAIHTDCVTDAAILTAAAMLKAGRTPRLHRAALCQLQSFLPPCSTLTASSPTHTQRHRRASVRVTAPGHGSMFPQRTIMKL